MKLISYLDGVQDRLGVVVKELVYPVDELNGWLPRTMEELLACWDDFFPFLRKVVGELEMGWVAPVEGLRVGELELLAPVPFPTSCRDGYAFRQHVETARRNRGAEMIAAFDEYPVFYFTNHQGIQGPGPVDCMADHLEQLDFELEVAVVVCRQGINIKAEEADQHIGGLMIMNDLSARRLQMEEMLLNLGPAKGKDFATAIGPWLVTLDELVAYEVATKEGHTGRSWDLPMKAFVNGVQVSRGNLRDMDWTFAELLERASYGVMLYPGDVIGSGTVGTGCFLELNGTGKLQDPAYREQWLVGGDEVVLDVAHLGRLANHIVELPSDWSLLRQKK